jgi:RNA polymerase sigma-70 factor (ECF subfamily)
MTTDPLVRFLKKRSRRRFASLVAALREPVLNAAYRVLGDAALAEDVAQEVFLKVLTARWRPEEVRSGRGLLVSTAVLQARMKRREGARRSARERRAFAERPAAGSGASPEDVDEVREAVGGLPEELRQSVELRYFGGLELSEVAAHLGVSLRTVNARLKEARELLRLRLAPTAGAAAAALLGGEAQAAWPSLPVSAALEEKLRRLAADGAAFARIAAGPRGIASASRRALLCAGALVLASAAAAGAWQLGQRGGGRADLNAGRPPLEASRPPAIAGAPRAAAAPLAADAPPAAPADGGIPAGAAAPLETARADTAGLRIRVVDESGRLVQALRLRLELPAASRMRLSELPPDRQAALVELEPLVAEAGFAAANPFEVDEIPKDLCEIAIGVQAEAPGFAPSGVERFTLSAGKTLELELMVSAPRLAVATVRDARSEEPIAGARVISLTEAARRRRDPAAALRDGGAGTGTTGEDGVAWVEGLGPGLHDLEVYADGFSTAKRAGVDPQAPQEFLLERAEGAGTVTVRVIDFDGNPVAGVEAALEAGGDAAAMEAKSDADGLARFEGVRPGRHRASLRGKAWFQWRRRLVKEHSGMAGRLKEAESFELAAAGSASVQLGVWQGTSVVEGLVVGLDGEPRAGAKVALYRETEVFLVKAEADGEGRVRFERLPAGRYFAAVGGDEGSRDEPWGLVDGERVEKRWTLSDRKIRGRVIHEDGGRPAASALVWINGPRAKLASADESGAFVVHDVLPGPYTVSAGSESENLLESEVEVEVAGAEDPPALEIRLRQGGRIHLRVEDRDGKAAKDATARCVDASGREHALVSTAAAEAIGETIQALVESVAGKRAAAPQDPVGAAREPPRAGFRSAVLAPGRYRVQLAYPNEPAEERAVDVQPGADTEVEW